MAAWWAAGRALARRLGRDEASAYAAALTYNLLFALFPLLLAMAALVPALHLSSAQRSLVHGLSVIVTPEVVRLLTRVGARSGTPNPALAVAGGAGYIWGMSAAFRRLIDAFNHAYEYRPPLRRPAWQTALLSGVLALTLGVGLVVALLVATLGQHLTQAWLPASARPLEVAAVAVLRWVALLALALLMLAVLYWVGPDRPRPFRWVSPGSVAAMGVWLLISFGFSLYLTHFNAYNVVYGSVGAVILLLLYLYFLSYALLLGAEINALREAGHLARVEGL